MKNIREIITDLNVARSNSCSKEKSEEIKKIINDLLPHEKQEKALEIIRNIGILRPYETIGGQCWLETMCDATKITKDNYDLLKEVLYAKGS